MPITKASSSAVAPGAKGDLVVGSATNDSGILAVGSTNQVLTVDSSTATGLKWASASAAAKSYTLINAGGTNLTAATDITVSGFSGYNNIVIYIENASSVNASSEIKLQVNSGGSVSYNGVFYVTDSGTNVIDVDFGSGTFWLYNYGRMGNTATNRVNAVVIMDAANSTGIKPFTWSSIASASTDGQSSTGSGFSANTSAITSVTVNSSTGNFDAGKIYVYGAL